MNHPASFPGTLLANFTGINYKFSQAEWNPRNLEETTLQVLYDPGWLLKWIGSLGICVGIAIMFYWRPGGRDPAPAQPASGRQIGGAGLFPQRVSGEICSLSTGGRAHKWLTNSAQCGSSRMITSLRVSQFMSAIDGLARCFAFETVQRPVGECFRS